MKNIFVIFIIHLCFLSGSGYTDRYSYLTVKERGVEDPPTPYFNIMEFYKNLSLENLTCWHEGVFYIEEWTDVRNYNGLYQGSNFGRIKRIGRVFVNSVGARREYFDKILRGYVLKNRFRVSLRNDGKYKDFFVHRIVAYLFIGDPSDVTHEINHIDCNPLNNFFKNLEWCTHQYNIDHSWAMGRQIPARGFQRKTTQPVRATNINTGEVEVYQSLTQATTMLGKNTRQTTAISRCCKESFRKLYGRKWEYITREEYNASSS